MHIYSHGDLEVLLFNSITSYYFQPLTYTLQYSQFFSDSLVPRITYLHPSTLTELNFVE